jgi:RNA polymerase sigma factor (sigma-70 family)
MKTNLPLSLSNESIQPAAATFFLDGIASGNSFVINRIFKDYLPSIRRFVLLQNGTAEDAEDIFMDAIEAICKRVNKGGFQLTCSFYTYLFEVCKRLWWKQLRRRKFQAGLPLESPKVLAICTDEPALSFREEEALLREKMRLLAPESRQVLQLVMEEKDMKAIVVEMGFNNEGHARKRKFDAKRQLAVLIQKDVRYKELVA